MQNSLSFDRSHFILLQRIKIFIKQEKDKERIGKERKGKEKGKDISPQYYTKMFKRNQYYVIFHPDFFF